MSGGTRLDAVVVGGGVAGATTAIELARAGMTVALVERDGVCRGASGVNAGTLSLQFVELPMVPYARRGRELWQRAGAWLGPDVGFIAKGVFTLAFTADEAVRLEALAAARREAGAATELVPLARARAIEPALSPHLAAASYSALDGMVDASLVGLAFLAALRDAGVEVHEGSPVEAAWPEANGYALRAGDRVLAAKRLVLAGGAWTGRMTRWLGVELPFGCYVNQMSVTERVPRVLGSTLGVVQRKLTLKQARNGTFIIGGGWQGEGDPERGAVGIIPANLTANLRLARYALPALGSVRIVRTWLGLQDGLPDGLPALGPVPGCEGAFMIACGLSGFTMGPCMGRLMAQLVLGREPEMPLFDPARFLGDHPPHVASCPAGADRL